VHELLSAVSLLSLALGGASLVVAWLCHRKTKDPFVRHFLVMYAGLSLLFLTMGGNSWLLPQAIGAWWAWLLPVASNLALFYMLWSVSSFMHHINGCGDAGRRDAAVAVAAGAGAVLACISFSIDPERRLIVFNPLVAAADALFLAILLYGLALTVRNFRRARDPGLRATLGEFMVLNACVLPFVLGSFAPVALNGWELHLAEPGLMSYIFPVFYAAVSVVFLVGFYRNDFFIITNPFATSEIHPDFLRRHNITGRETEVLRCLIRGFDNKQIAAELDIQVVTVKKHLASVFEKTGVASRFELIVLIKSQPGSR
jgi:DNA-binding CsgD family transcriptional regulator